MRLPGKKSFLHFILLLLLIKGQGQSYYFRHYQVDDGLAHNTVITIIQDSKGMMWMGTKGGLNRFDGYTFKTYRNENNKFGALGNNVIASICEDHNGMLWIGTGRGIFKYNTLTETFTELPLTPTAHISNILVDKVNDLWFLADGNLFHYRQDKDKIESLGIKAGCLAFDRHMDLWMGHDDGSISRYNSSASIQMITRTLPLNLKQISKIYPADSGPDGDLLLVGTTKQGLKSYNSKTGQIRSLLLRNKDSTEIFVRDIVRSGANEYWIATESGIYIYNLATDSGQNLRKRTGDPYSITDNAVYSLCKDNQGSLWAGTFFGGLNYFSAENARFGKYYPLQNSNSIAGNAVREIVSDDKNNIWIGTEDAGIDKWDPHTGKFTNFTTNGKPSGLSYPNIHGLLAVGDRLYVGPFQHGLEIMDIPTGRIIDRFPLIGGRDSLLSDFVMCIHRMADSTLLIGTTGASPGLYGYDPAKRTFKKCRQVPDGLPIYAIMEDHEGTIWTGSLDNGVFWFDPKTGKKGNISFSSSGDHPTRDYPIQGIFEDSNHAIWFATEGGGLIRLNADHRSFKKFTTQDGLPTNNIFRMLEDGHRNLWISSLKGLICLDLRTEKFKVYTQSNGLLTDQFNYNSAFKDRSGKMYFGSVKGMIAFNPDDFGRSSFPPPIYITGFQVNNKELVPDSASSPLKRSILYTDTIGLEHDQSTFSIEFAALNYSSPTVTRYQYFMQGLDKEWTYLNSNRKAYFTDLSPGSYTFIVRAESNVGSWTGKETRLFIKVAPPFWKSGWAWLFYLIATGIVLWLSTRYYHRYMVKKSLTKLRLFEHQKEKEIYQAKIEFFTNIAHEIQTPLALILGPLELIIKKVDDIPSIKKNLLMMDKNGRRLLELTGQLLDFRRTEADQFGLSFVNTDITNLLNEQITTFRQEAEKANITLTTEFPATHLIAFVDIEAFVKIVSNLLSNAIKYAASWATISIVPFDAPFAQADSTFVRSDTALKQADNSSVPADTAFGAAGSSLVIRFINDGKPIPEEFRQKIFEPFFRLRSNERPGTGIGLALARSLTELHNGSLDLVSGDANNIVFELSLPVHQKFEFKLSKWKNSQ